LKYFKRLILGVKGVIFGVSTLDRVVINSKHGNYNNKCILIVEKPILLSSVMNRCNALGNYIYNR
ncbi:MAG: hypothetical protein K6G19_04690, partial [Lachnospiraceae bacterium]|nr:hypothetical protein [Lachnospiraceae bacterium]